MNTETLIISIVMAVFFGFMGVILLLGLIMDGIFWSLLLVINVLASIGTFINYPDNHWVSLWMLLSLAAVGIAAISEDSDMHDNDTEYL